jgi:transposase-like protein
LENLLNLELEIASITCDGHKATLKAISKVMPYVVVQRCLVHIQRICLLWIIANPTYDAGK